MKKAIKTKQELKDLPDEYFYRAFYCEKCDKYSETGYLYTKYGFFMVRVGGLENWPVMDGDSISEDWIGDLKCWFEHPVLLVFSTEKLDAERATWTGGGEVMGGSSDVLSGSAGYHSQH